ncbi:NAD-dependent succinate-semialdehyde dehydrogenase [Terriglobus roseus]|uniref:Succinate-semialdehyde dehydrogenase / glutarate-semialdehyde dehydrogenase n=1 Tax=Terriglobus roseus TaxID=392734 RepID=A0A1G7KLT2_9BACT|nr:NAD-dependent succinate-semialdehyde dehydrogenase [Terriglobus roseus]SDF38004.1 succinate-semialdehyde dehydrogenase / glutarate-semialdehyde dehydrogenase [Terriglobus roseus]
MFTSINPATGVEVAMYEEIDLVELENRLVLASSAFESWRTSLMTERQELLTRIADNFETNKHRLAAMATTEMGKTYSSAIAEAEKCAAVFRYYAQHGVELLQSTTTKLPSGKTAETIWLPLGAILAIMPWNFPYWQVARFIAPTIMAGNVGLLKHAPNVQGCAALLEEVVQTAGAPTGVFQNLPIQLSVIPDLIADDRVAAVTLTGSERAGCAVGAQAGGALKKVVLELGGSDPFIVMPSANLDEAVPQAVKARIQNTGQSCICGKRMIVHADIYDEFLERFVSAMKAVKAGDPLKPDTDMGPLSSLAQRDLILKQIEKAKQEGARLLVGGEVLEGRGAYLSAGVLVDLPTNSSLMREEIFGPIAIVLKAENIDEAIEIANDVPYGLGSSVWTNDFAEQGRFAREIEAGMTAFNQILVSMPEVSFGGIKRSGHGRELGSLGLHEFMNAKTVLYSH